MRPDLRDTQLRRMMDEGLTLTDASVLSLQAEMREDKRFKALCEKHGLPWDFDAGYKPR